MEARRVGVLVVGGALVGVLATEPASVPELDLDPGTIATRTVKAPYGFTWEDEAAYADARRRAAEGSPVVLLHDPGLPDAVEAGLRAALDGGRGAGDPGRAAATVVDALALDLPTSRIRPLAEAGFPPEAGDVVLRWWREGMRDRLVLADRAVLPTDGRAVAIAGPDGAPPTELPVGDPRLVGLDAAREAVSLAALRERRDEPWAGAAEELARALVRPNVVLDPARTAARRAEAEARVRPEAVAVQRGEIVFREGDRLDARQVALYRAMLDRSAEHGVAARSLATGAFAALLLGTLYVGVRGRFRMDTGTRDLVAVTGLVVLQAMFARLVGSSAPGIAALSGGDVPAEAVWRLLPLAGGAMLLRILMGPYRVAIHTLAAASVATVALGGDALLLVGFLLTSLVGAASVVRVRERIGVLRAGVGVGVFGAAVAPLLHVVDTLSSGGAVGAASSLWMSLFALLGGLLSGFFVLAVLPLFELFGFVTDLRLLELASLNHPLLRQLMLRAPGTYHHSVMVGTLAEAACDAIGANSLQAKVAAYFHDVGKAVEPRYFAENQRGANPHHELDPRESAAVLVRHVTEGARMAHEHRLPKPILDNILMHHGTGLISYFFAAARDAAKDPETVDEAVFRYPGPKPSTREAGVIMLADKVEAATRTLRHPTEENVRAMIARILGSVLADHQFTECPLTFEELHVIAETFVEVLLAIHHQRVEYPATAAISRAGPAPGATGDVPLVEGAVGSITLELERARLAEPPAAAPDDAADYEAVDHLPSGRS